MLTEQQFNFLEDFMKATSKNKNETKVLEFYNRQKVDAKILKELLINHPDLYPAEPYNEKNIDDTLEGSELIDYIEIYLGRIGLKECIDIFPPNMYGISLKGLEELDNYRREVKFLEYSKESNDIAREANEKSKKANIVSWFSLALSGLVFLAGVATLILEIIKFVSNK